MLLIFGCYFHRHRGSYHYLQCDLQPAERKQSEFAPELEPDPEFSRSSTEESKSLAVPLYKKDAKDGMQKLHPQTIFRFIEDQPAVAASALVAMTSAVIALRKSL
ncbi:unnamed protein product [Symbiodinium pilosum]|uniref:Uncharacterized protein n=1 Tax=Symbiodinium pilosum TaxID=2952 RepID=A0A812K231_SYMPI|nr:unnamed protein product [Symbiodinium pilosum]